MQSSIAVFLHSDRYDSLYQASSTLLAASAMGWSCHLFLFDNALASYVEGKWDVVNIAPPSPWDGDCEPPPPVERLQRGFETANLPSLYDMIEKARDEGGGLRIFACSTSCKVLGLELRSVREKVDEIVGLPTMLRMVEKTTHVMHI